MKYDIKQITKWEAPKENGVPILCMPNVPLPLHTCFRGDAEVLTSLGWKKIPEVTMKDLVATWDIQTEKIVWDYPYDTIKSYAKQLVRIKQKNHKTFATLVTPGHRIPVRAKRDSRRQCNKIRIKDGDKELWHLTETTAAKLNMNSYKHFITASRNGTDLDTELTDAERVYISLQADGSVRRSKMNNMRHNNRYVDTKNLFSFRIALKKERKKQRLEALLDSSGIKYTRQNHDDGSYAMANGYQKYDVWVPYNCKNFWECFDITSFGQKKAQQFIDEIALWDGSCEETCGILNRRYVTTVEDNARFAQAVAVIAGVTSSLQIRCADREKNSQETYIIDFLDRDFRTVQSCEKEIVEHDGPVYCINVPTSYFVVRDGESKSVMITGNCAPRTIMGEYQWGKVRKRENMKQDYTCQASGVELGDGKATTHLHELYTIDYASHTATFERYVVLDPKLHTKFIHSGRALTLFEKGEPYMTKEGMLETLEYGFSLIDTWNREHPDDEPLRVSTVFLDWKDNPQLKDDVKRLIEEYHIKFYDFDKKCFNKENWGKWKLIYKGKEYPTKFATQEEWEDHFNPKPKVEDPFESDTIKELDKMIEESNGQSV